MWDQVVEHYESMKTATYEFVKPFPSFSQWEKLNTASQKIINDWISYADLQVKQGSSLDPAEQVSAYSSQGVLIAKTVQDLGLTTWQDVLAHYQKLKTQ